MYSKCTGFSWVGTSSIPTIIHPYLAWLWDINGRSKKAQTFWHWTMCSYFLHFMIYHLLSHLSPIHHIIPKICCEDMKCISPATGTKPGLKFHLRRCKLGQKFQSRTQSPVAHACNPSYLGSWDWDDRGLRSAWESSQDPISINCWAQWCIPVVPNYSGGWDQEDWFQASPGKKVCKTPSPVSCLPSDGRKHKLGEW
jgi:hypothetical protein